MDVPAELSRVIGRRVRENRELLGLTREKLAEMADISTSFLADVEAGRKNMTTNTLYKLCPALGVSADYLIFGRAAADEDNISRLLSGTDPVRRRELEQLLRAAAELVAGNSL